MNKSSTISFLSVAVLSLGIFLSSCGPTIAQEERELDITLWENTLTKFVNEDGRVNYDALKADQSDLNLFVDQLIVADVDALSAIDQKTFWINAYNAITLKVVSDKYPVKSIRKINFGLVFEIPREVAQGKKSLSYIEHKIIRPLGDPRIHFAINCASIGCPNLPDIPFYTETLDARLDEEAKKFINNPGKVRLDRSTNTLYYSAIFDWFEKDFLVVESDILSYIMKYINDSDRQYLEANEVKLKVLKYDWGINKQ